MAEVNKQGIGNIKYDFAKPSDNWSIAYFRGQYEAQEELSKVDLNNTKGLEYFFRVVNSEMAKDLDNQTIQGLYNQIKTVAQGSLLANSERNAGKLVSTLDKENSLEYILKSPTFDNPNDKSYSEIVNYKQEAEKVQQKIQENPRAYLEKIFEGLSPETIRIWAPFQQKIVEGSIRRNQRRVVSGLEKYGIAKFVETNIRTARNLEGELEKAHVKLSELAQKKANKLTEEKGRELTPYELAQVNESFSEDYKKLEEKYGQNIKASQSLPQMILQLQSLTYQTIIAKEREAKEREAKEKRLTKAA